MDEARADFKESVTEHKVNINHFVPAAAKRMTEKDYAARSGPCKIVSLPNLPTLENRIRFCLRGDTQAAFAKKLGVAINTVCQWCSGIRTPRRNMMYKIAEAGGVPVEWLIGGQAAQTSGKDAKVFPVIEEQKAEEHIFPAFSLQLNGEYTGKTISHILSGLLEDYKYTVKLTVEA